MLRPSLLLMTVALATVVTSPRAAAANCIDHPAQSVAEVSDTVWWGTVTDAIVGPMAPGVWQLTVRVEDVLKGPGSPGASAVVFLSTCGPYASRTYAGAVASDFVGAHRLFMGQIDTSGALVSYSDVLSPQRSSQRQQYDKVSDELASEPTGPLPSQPSSRVWFLGIIALVAAVSAIALVTWRGRRRA